MIYKEVKQIVAVSIVLIIIIFAAFFRVRAYQDSLSMASSDTGSFILTATEPFFSKQFFSSIRPPAVPLLYKILQPAQGYDVTDINLAWLGTSPDRVYQAGLDRITLFQSMLSIFAWSLLAFSVSFRFHTLFAKISVVILTLSFAYVPQLADWDGVLLAESVSFSFFAIILALTIDLIFRLTNEGKKISVTTIFIMVAWCFCMLFWSFTRDSNAYVALLSAVLLIMLTILPWTRRLIPVRSLLLIAGFLFAVYFTHSATLHKSDRWVNPLLNNYIKNVFPYKDRVEYFEKFGMPISEEILAFQTSFGNEQGFLEHEEFMAWVRENGYSTYPRFLLTHIGWSFEKLYSDLDPLFYGNRQPYFNGTPESTPLWLLPLGNKLHMLSKNVIFYDFVLTVLIVGFLIKTKKHVSYAWIGIVLWLLMVEFALLFISYHGDALGLQRHTLVAIIPFRYSFWLLSVLLLDMVLSALMKPKNKISKVFE